MVIPKETNDQILMWILLGKKKVGGPVNLINFLSKVFIGKSTLSKILRKNENEKNLKSFNIRSI